MKQFTILITGIILFSLQGYSQQVEQVVLGSEQYEQLKAAMLLNSGQYEVVYGENPNIGFHPEVYPAGHGTSGRDINCGCWIEPDATYTLLQNITGTFDDGSSSNINMPFTFNLYDDSYSSFYININGNVTFGNPVATFSPEGFPSGIAAMLAPFWADVDLRCADCGEIYYKVTEDAVFVNWVDVAYYNQNTDKKNSFQLIFTDGNNDFVGVGRNTSFCFEDMQWTTGDASQGNNGFGGSAATVGSNKGDGSTFLQFGRFSQNNSNYDGPFGSEDGVSWLDFQSFVFNSASEDLNIAPIATNTGLCDTIQVCLNETAFISVEFIAPEQGQTVTIDLDTGGLTGISDITVEEGSSATLTFQYTGLEENIGVFPITVVATDDGTPVASTSITTFLEVINVLVPDLTVEGATAFCDGNTTVLTASPGFDSYQWNPNGCSTAACEFSSEGVVTVTATIDICAVTSAPIELVEEDYFIPAINIAQNPVCSNDSTLVTLVDEYADYTWNNYQDFPGTLYGPLDGQSAYASSGTFVVNVTSFDGCPGQRIFNIDFSDADIPEDTFSGLYCDETEVTFCCGSTTAQGGNFNMSFITNPNNPNVGPWITGANVDVFLNGELVFEAIPTAEQVANSLGQITISIPGVVYGDIVTIVYNNPEGSPLTTGLNVTNCLPFPSIPVPLNPDGGVVWDNLTNCNYTPAAGEWTVISGPEGATFSDTEEFNTTFTAGDYGTYELNFFSETCGIDYQYELIFGLPPSLSTESNAFELCEGETQELSVTTEDPLEDSDFSWNTNETEETITVTESGTYCATIVNQCATLEECIEVNVIPLPSIDVEPEYLLCDGDTESIDPIENNDDTFVYAWTSDQGFDSDADVAEISVPAVYEVTVSNICGTDTESFNVTALPSPAPALPANTSICGDETVTLDPIEAGLEHPSFGYDWSSPNGFDSNAAEVTVSESDTYTVTVSNDCGSVNAVAVVTITPIPSVSVDDEYALCDGSNLEVDPIENDDDSFVYSWTSVDGFSSSADVTSITVSSTYTITVSNDCGTSEENFDVIAIPLPVVSLPLEALLCDGEALTLDPIDGASEHPSFEYDWSSANGFSSSNTEVSVNQTDVYTVVVSNGCGEATASSDVSAFVSPIVGLDPVYNICDGDEITLNPVANLNPSFITSWTGPNNFVSDNSSVTINQAGNYTFTADNICLAEPIVVNTVLEFNVAPEFQLNFDVTFLCPNAGSLLIADVTQGENINWTWSLACGPLGTPELIESALTSSYEVYSDQFPAECLETGALYILNASNACGSASDTTLAFADPCLIVLPNIFTPDGDRDELNEFFAIEGLDFYILRGGVKLKVYNRWGALVYEDDDYQNNWDAKDVSDGTYFYQLILPDDGSTEYSGVVQVVRN